MQYYVKQQLWGRYIEGYAKPSAISNVQANIHPYLHGRIARREVYNAQNHVNIIAKNPSTKLTATVPPKPGYKQYQEIQVKADMSEPPRLGKEKYIYYKYVHM